MGGRELQRRRDALVLIADGFSAGGLVVVFDRGSDGGIPLIPDAVGIVERTFLELQDGIGRDDRPFGDRDFDRAGGISSLSGLDRRLSDGKSGDRSVIGDGNDLGILAFNDERAARDGSAIGRYGDLGGLADIDGRLVQGEGEALVGDGG